MYRFLLVAALASCNASAADHCNDYIDLLCTRVIECGMLTDTQASCVDRVAAAMSCSRATRLGSGYDRCIDQLESGPCEDFLRPGDMGSTWFIVPSICDLAFEYDEDE